MMKFIQFLVFIFFINTSVCHGGESSIDKFALIYNGPNTCPGCPETIATIIEKTHLPVKYVSNPKLIPNLLNHTAIFIIGGTDDNIETMRLLFSSNIVEAIKKYLKNGGRYLGICGGGFIAARYYMAEENVWVKGFNIIPADAIDYSETSKPHLEPILWNGKKVTLFFQGGPQFNLIKKAKKYEIIAKYRNGDIAALKYLFGKGSVIVIGPHPEADKTWLRKDNIDSTHWHPKQELLLNLIQDELAH